MPPTGNDYPVMASEYILPFPQVPQTKCEL
jgi:hypothetical protein